MTDYPTPSGSQQPIGPDGKKIGSVVQRIEASAWRGPLPSPDDLRAYENLVPGAAERLIKMAEKQSEHRRSLERLVIESGARNSTIGVFVGFVIALVALALAGYAIYEGRSQTGTAIVMTTISGLVGVFVIGKYLTHKERVQRDERE